MDIRNLEFILILLALIVGMVSAGYFYEETNVFTATLKRPLKTIASGMILISFGILLAVFISYFQNQGYAVTLYNIPIASVFYILYIIGSILIFVGARSFVYKPVIK
jgi:hypothetical protein